MELKADLSSVLAMMDCPNDSSMAQELTGAFYQLQPELAKRCSPKFKYCLGKLPFAGKNASLKKKSPVIFSIITLGSLVSDFVLQQFEKGNHLQALLADAMLNSMLFSFQDQVVVQIGDYAKSIGYGIEGVYEAPTDIDAVIQDYIVEITGAKDSYGITLTSGHMLSPEKSMCQIYLLSQDVAKCNYKHDCSNCQASGCGFRK